MRNIFSFLRGEAGAVLGFSLLVVVLVMWSVSARATDGTIRLYDAIRTTDTRSEAVIVGIDDKSLQALGAWPWNRDTFAKLTQILNREGARIIVFDVLFLEPRPGDELFKEELSLSKAKIILASKLEGGSYLSSYLSDSSSTRAFSSLANVYPDKDGKVRKYPAPYFLNGECVSGLGESAFLLYTMGENSACRAPGGMFRYPKSIATYSLIDVLEGKVELNSLKGKVVFIGSTALDLEDHFIGSKGNKLPGVYVHASIFISLLDSVHDRILSPAATSLSIILLMLVVAYGMYRIRSVGRQIMMLLVFVAVLSVVAAISFSYGLQLPFLPYLISICSSAGYVVGTGFMRERRKNAYIQSLFSKYVHKDVLNELISSGGEIKLGGEKRELSVLFSDIRGFTALSEELSPEELTHTLNAYLSRMMPEILEEKGTVDKFIGDAIMAFWNAPLPLPDHALHSVRSALRMQDALRDFNQEQGTSLAIGVGIHTGSAVVGNVGGKDRVNYTALGDTVNLASRLEGLTKKYGVPIIITKAVRDAITDESITFRCLDVITVMGKKRPTTLYEPRWKNGFREGFTEGYEKALTYYYEKEWNKAEQLFKKMAKEGDIPSQVLLARIPDIRKREKWDGVWKWDEK